MMPSDVYRIKQVANDQRRQYKEAWLDHINEAEEESQSHFWHKNQNRLITKSQILPGDFIIGNGASIYSSAILPALETAEHEVIFVTCFWARSESLSQLGETLIELSQRSSSRPNGTPKLRVCLCFSSRSLLQKLFHTSSSSGSIYPRSTWVSKLGLPPHEALSGLDLQIKSLFLLPFCVMHPKFVIMDRKRALMPSCNLSYQSWFEGCVPLMGPIVSELVRFWEETWGEGMGDLPPVLSSDANEYAGATTEALVTAHTITLLPSPYHRSPRFRPFIGMPEPPVTPLNVYLENAIATAKTDISILTPNLTSRPVMLWLLAALARGVNITIITNRRMMVLEQLLTAGTLTEICVWRLKQRYMNLVDTQVPTSSDLENGRGRKIGALAVGYFRPNSQYAKSHFKCTIVDGKTVVLGSGNMDRASWYTSQELGVAVDGEDIVSEVWGKVMGDLETRMMGGVEWV